MSRVRRLLLLLLPAVAMGPVAFLAAPAHADAPPALPAYAAYIVDHLRTDPVFVSEDMSLTVPASAVAGLRRAVAAAPGYQVYVIIAPQDGQRTRDETILALVHGGLDRPGVYVLSHGRGVTAAAYGVDAPAVDAATAVYLESDYETAPATRVERTLALLVSGDAPARLKNASDHYEQLAADRQKDPHDVVFERVAFGVAAGIILLLLARRLVSLRAVARRRTRPAENPTPRDRESLERLGESSLRTLRARLQSLPNGLAPERRERAFDNAEAASRLLQRPAADGPDRSCDLVAATVLARQGLELVGGKRALNDAVVHRPCFFNPLHTPGASTTVHWQDGRGHDAQVAACADCAEELAHGRAVDALVLPGRHGGDAPWWDAGCAPLWTRTGFGALGDDLATQVLVEVPAAVDRP